MQRGIMKHIFVIFFFLSLFFIASFTNGEEARATSILLDVSRSLSFKEFEKIKATLEQWIDQYPSTDQLSLYIFGAQVQKIKSDQLKTVRANEAYTMFYDAAYEAMQDLAKRKVEKKSVLVFSDGNDTRSVTTLEDIVSLAKAEGIAIHCIGIGKANRKLLGRLAKLTGGNFFSAGEADLISKINTAIADQKITNKPETPRPMQASPVPASPVVAAPAASKVAVPADENKGTPYLTIVGISAVALIAGVGVYFFIRRRGQIRTCPTCNRPLESYQTICPECPGQTKILSVPQPSTEDHQELESVPAEWYELKQDTQEIMTKTFYLSETPVLVVTKGPDLGQSYQLSKEVPVSIGRSRVNEIRPSDGSISAQHCKIIPENGKHVLYDLGSTNGTLLNDKKVKKGVLKHGDTIRVGETFLQYKIEQKR
jgi:FHA domain/von Willebrand factor type A domain